MPEALEFLIGCSGPVHAAAFTPEQVREPHQLMMLAFGVGFVFPVLLVFLELVGVVTPKQLSQLAPPGHRVIVVVRPRSSPRAATRSAMLALAVPMYVFYECLDRDRLDR